MEIIHLVLTKNTYIILNRFTKFPSLISTYIFVLVVVARLRKIQVYSIALTKKNKNLKFSLSNLSSSTVADKKRH
jgi:hypothetical protein